MTIRDPSLNDTPLVENNTPNVRNSDFINLQTEIGKLLQDFLQKNEIPNAYSFAYGVDSLKDFTSFGENSASSDCYMCIYDEHNKSIITSM